MSADEIVKALRTTVHIIGACDDNVVFAALKGHMTDAADLIESLQAQLAERDAEIARLTAERTAMLEALHKSDIDCDSCKHSHGGECENADFDCMTCDCDCICKSCRDNSNWEWRGATSDN